MLVGFPDTQMLVKKTFLKNSNISVTEKEKEKKKGLFCSPTVIFPWFKIIWNDWGGKKNP